MSRIDKALKNSIINQRLDKLENQMRMILKSNNDVYQEDIVHTVRFFGLDSKPNNILEGIYPDAVTSYVINDDYIECTILDSLINFDALLQDLRHRFHNPYLIIDPDNVIILDFKLDTSIYDVSELAKHKHKGPEKELDNPNTTSEDITIHEINTQDHLSWGWFNDALSLSTDDTAKKSYEKYIQESTKSYNISKNVRKALWRACEGNAIAKVDSGEKIDYTHVVDGRDKSLEDTIGYMLNYISVKALTEYDGMLIIKMDDMLKYVEVVSTLHRIYPNIDYILEELPKNEATCLVRNIYSSRLY